MAASGKRMRAVRRIFRVQAVKLWVAFKEVEVRVWTSDWVSFRVRRHPGVGIGDFRLQIQTSCLRGFGLPG
jgi:hypothetical protein